MSSKIIKKEMDLVNAKLLQLEAASMPPKFLISHVTPSADQGNRGDCWMFSTGGLIESSYLDYGLKKGWLNGSTYMKLNRQALGVAIMEECKKTPVGGCPTDEDPSKPGGFAFGNTDEGKDGGDEHIWAQLEGMQTPNRKAVIPGYWEGCEYVTTLPPTPEGKFKAERNCTGLMEVRKKNPLSYKVTGMKAHYGRADIKKALVELDKTLSLGIQIAFASWFQPCDKRYHCDPKNPTVVDHTGTLVATQCVPCPTERVFASVDCCVFAQKAMVSMQGEWYMQATEPLITEGGHAVSIVGYNDHYRDEHGSTGGFILRNSWKDGLGTSHGLKARGSHTAAYYAQLLSPADESQFCPNPNSPRNWNACGDVKACKSKMTEMTVAVATDGTVVTLKCQDGGNAIPKVCTASLWTHLRVARRPSSHFAHTPPGRRATATPARITTWSTRRAGTSRGCTPPATSTTKGMRPTPSCASRR